jgi:Mce-associated membrane protein
VKSLKTTVETAATDAGGSGDDESPEEAVAENSSPPEDAGATETEFDEVDPPPTRDWKSLARAGIHWVATLAVAAVLAGAGYEGWLLFERHQSDLAAAQALDAARKYAVTLTSTDPNAVDQNFTDVLNGATGEFKDTYTKAGSKLRKMLIDNKVTTQGTVVDSAIKSAGANKVEVLLFVRQSVTNAANPDPRMDLTAVTMTMEKVNGRWLASKVVLPGGQG